MKKLICTLAATLAFASAAFAQYPFRDNDPTFFEGNPPNRYAIHGIDISRYQGTIDWNTVRAQKIAFAYLKATEGSDIVDPTYFNNVWAAYKAGVRVGAYHFYHFCTSPDAQFANFSRVVERSNGWLPPVVDLEWNHQSSCTRQPNPYQMQQEVQRFLNLLQERYGTKPIIYTNPSFYRETGIAAFKGKYEFWLRSTAANPSITYPGQAWVFWQYTGTGSLVGINGNVDINAFAGSVEDWSSWIGARGVKGIPGVY